MRESVVNCHEHIQIFKKRSDKMKRRKALLLMLKAGVLMLALTIAYVLLTGIFGRVSIALLGDSGKFHWIVYLVLLLALISFAYQLFQHGKAAYQDWISFRQNEKTESWRVQILRYPNLAFAFLWLLILFLAGVFFALGGFLSLSERSRFILRDLSGGLAILSLVELFAWDSLVSDLKLLRDALNAANGGKVKWLFRYTNLTAAAFLLSSSAFYFIATELCRHLNAFPHLRHALLWMRFVPIGLAILYTVLKDEWRNFKEKYLDAFFKPNGEEETYWNPQGTPRQSAASDSEAPPEAGFSIYRVREFLQELSQDGHAQGRKPFVTPTFVFLSAYAILVLLFGIPIFADIVRNIWNLGVGMFGGLYAAIFEQNPDAAVTSYQVAQKAFFANALDMLFLFFVSWGVFLGLSFVLYLIVKVRRQRKKYTFHPSEESPPENPEHEEGD